MSRRSVEIILYVRNQEAARDFYAKLLDQNPLLDVPGMTEFQLAENLLLGLMPEAGIAKVLKDKTPDPAIGNGIPRCELYLTGENPALLLERALSAGATLVSEFQARDWGHKVAYVSDPDGHILAFAEKL